MKLMSFFHHSRIDWIEKIDEAYLEDLEVSENEESEDNERKRKASTDLEVSGKRNKYEM